MRNLSGKEAEFTGGFLGYQFVLPQTVILLVALIQFQGIFTLFFVFGAEAVGVGQQLGQRQDGDGVRTSVRLIERFFRRLGVKQPAESDDLDHQI